MYSTPWCAGRAQKHQFGALPTLVGNGVPVDLKVLAGQAGHVMYLGLTQERGTFVNLIERIGRQHHRVMLTVQHGLGKSKQGLARAIDGQDLGFGVQSHVIAALNPAGTCLPEGQGTRSGRISRQSLVVLAQILAY